MKPIKFISFFLAAIFSASICLSAQTRKESAGPLIWDMRQIEQLRSDAAFLAMAERYAHQQPAVVTRKAVLVSADVHNFESIASYLWPDLQNPGKWVVRDGQFNPGSDNFNRTDLFAVTRNLIVLSKAYYVTRNPLYKKAYRHQLRAWHLDRQTYMNPNFAYAQMIVGRRAGNRGEPGGLIDAYHTINIIESIRLMRSCGGLDGGTYRQVRDWYAQFENWMTTDELALEECARTNNHGLAYDITLYNMALFTGNTAHLEQVRSRFGTMRLEAQLLADGTQPAELSRTRPLHYSLFNLTHILDFCALCPEVYEQYKDRIINALDHLKPYCMGHAYYRPGDIDDLDHAEMVFRCQACRVADYDSRNLQPLSVTSSSEDLFHNIVRWEWEMYDYDDAISAERRSADKAALREYWEKALRLE